MNALCAGAPGSKLKVKVHVVTFKASMQTQIIFTIRAPVSGFLSYISFRMHDTSSMMFCLHSNGKPVQKMTLSLVGVVEFTGNRTQYEVSLVHVFLQSLCQLELEDIAVDHHVEWPRPQKFHIPLWRLLPFYHIELQHFWLYGCCSQNDSGLYYVLIPLTDTHFICVVCRVCCHYLLLVPGLNCCSVQVLTKMPCLFLPLLPTMGGRSIWSVNT